jgi:hypothetical protein
MLEQPPYIKHDIILLVSMKQHSVAGREARPLGIQFSTCEARHQCYVSATVSLLIYANHDFQIVELGVSVQACKMPIVVRVCLRFRRPLSFWASKLTSCVTESIADHIGSHQYVRLTK